MPNLVTAPNFALLASFDARQWSNTHVINYNSVSVSLPTYYTAQGIYEDGLFFLNGRGIGDTTPTNAMGTFTEAILALANFGVDWEVSLTSNDRVKVYSNTYFLVTPEGEDVLGLGSQAAVADGSGFSITGSTEWKRGCYRGEEYTFTNGTGTLSFTAFREQDNRPFASQDITTMFRERGLGDADDLNPTNCLEEVVRDQAGMEIRFILNESGHVEVWYLSSGLFGWADTTFRDRLGFNGREDAERVHGSTLTPYVVRIIAANPMPGALYPSRPFQDHHYSIESVTQARRKIGGGYTSNLIGTYTTSLLSFDLDALLDQEDLYRHFTDHFVPYASNGERVNFYQDVGDSRRSLPTASISFTQQPYDLVYTFQDNGDRGRLRCSIVTASYDLGFGALKRRVPVSLRLEHL